MDSSMISWVRWGCLTCLNRIPVISVLVFGQAPVFKYDFEAWFPLQKAPISVGFMWFDPRNFRMATWYGMLPWYSCTTCRPLGSPVFCSKQLRVWQAPERAKALRGRRVLELGSGLGHLGHGLARPVVGENHWKPAQFVVWRPQLTHLAGRSNIRWWSLVPLNHNISQPIVADDSWRVEPSCHGRHFKVGLDLCGAFVPGSDAQFNFGSSHQICLAHAMAVFCSIQLSPVQTWCWESAMPHQRTHMTHLQIPLIESQWKSA